MKSLLLALVAVLCFLAPQYLCVDTSSVNIGRRVYVAGKFNSVKQTDGTVLNTQNLVYWDGSAFKNISATIDGEVFAVKVTSALDVVIGGDFGYVNGVKTGPVARYIYATKTWVSIVASGATWSSGSAVHALAYDCTSLSLSLTTNRCNIYFGGKFTLNSGGVEARNIARYSGTDDKILNMGGFSEHGIQGTVYALYQKGQGFEDSAKILWVGGDLQTTATNARYFAKFTDCRSDSPSFVGLNTKDGTVDGIVRGFAYQRTILFGTTDKLVLAGDFDFTSNSGAKCFHTCAYNWRNDEFDTVADSTTAFGDDSAIVYSPGVELTLSRSITAYFFGGSFTGPTYKNLAKVKSGTTTSLHDQQASIFNSHDGYVKSIDVCSASSKACKSGTVSYVTSKGLVGQFDADANSFTNFGQGFGNSTIEYGNSVYSFAGAGTASLKVGAIAVAALAAVMML